MEPFSSRAFRLAICGGFGLALAVTSVPARAQQTTVYSYDAQGRLRSLGTGANSSATYQFDDADNRTVRTVGVAIGWSIQADGFDAYFYQLTYPDILAAAVDPYAHWLSNGSVEGRNPNRFFDAAYYRATYGLPATTNALTDYHTYGWTVGRNPSPEFSTSLYLAAYPDIAAANIDPLWHYLGWGFAEGRSRFPVP